MGSQSMVSNTFAVAVVVVLGLLSTTTVSTATTFTVGWTLPTPTYPDGFSVTNSAGVLNAADSLLFQYNTTSHDLLAVSKGDFGSCTTTSPIKKFDDGNTTIHHTIPGTFWYICGTPGHCGQGMKLAIVVPGISPSVAPGPGPGNYAVGLRPHATTSVMVAAAVILGLVAFRKL